MPRAHQYNARISFIGFLMASREIRKVNTFKTMYLIIATHITSQKMLKELQSCILRILFVVITLFNTGLEKSAFSS